METITSVPPARILAPSVFAKTEKASFSVKGSEYCKSRGLEISVTFTDQEEVDLIAYHDFSPTVYGGIYSKFRNFRTALPSVVDQIQRLRKQDSAP
jgi:hypothetical protein